MVIQVDNYTKKTLQRVFLVNATYSDIFSYLVQLVRLTL